LTKKEDVPASFNEQREIDQTSSRLIEMVNEVKDIMVDNEVKVEEDAQEGDAVESRAPVAVETSEAVHMAGETE